jgi:branched-chain amino acid transport system substrate-binding protein
MAHAFTRRPGLFAAAAVGIALALAGCSGGTPAATPSSETSAPAADDVFGPANAASGDPVVFGTLDLASGPVTFPEVLAAEQAAVEYINAYKGGIGGHPVKLLTCETDGAPATSQRCANQLLDEKPVAIIGGADVGSPGALPVWEGANLAYLGGVAFTPVEQSSPNSVIFSSVSTADNAAASVYAAQELKAKSAAVIYTSDTQGTSVAENVIIPTMTAAGITDITKIAIPPTSSDVASAVATAVGASPDVIYVNAPAACPNILSSLKQLGNQAAILGIDPCTSPPAIAGANGGAEGLYFAAPVLDPSAGTDETNLYVAVMKKYAPADVHLDSLSALGFQTMMNVQATLADVAPEDLTTESILAAFKDGAEHDNFMGHPYTCDGKQLAGAPSVCNSYQEIRQIKDGKPVAISDGWVTAGDFYQGTR